MYSKILIILNTNRYFVFCTLKMFESTVCNLRLFQPYLDIDSMFYYDPIYIEYYSEDFEKE